MAPRKVFYRDFSCGCFYFIDYYGSEDTRESKKIPSKRLPCNKNCSYTKVNGLMSEGSEVMAFPSSLENNIEARARYARSKLLSFKSERLIRI